MKHFQLFAYSNVFPIGIMLLLLIFTPGCKPGKNILREEKEQKTAFDLIVKTSESKPKVIFDWGIPRFASVSMPFKNSSLKDPVAKALNFVADNKSFFRVADPARSFILKRIQANDLSSNVFLAQVIDSIPVYGAELSIHSIKDHVFQMGGMYIPQFRLSDYPRIAKISPIEAYRIARKEVTCSDSFMVVEPTLCYFNARILMNKKELEVNQLDENTYLTYKIDLKNCGQGDKEIFIDATNGKRIFINNISPNHNPSKSFQIKSAGPCRNWATACGWPGATDWYNENGVLPGANPDAEGIGAFANLHKTYDFYFNKFHRHGWDGHDGTIWITLDADACPDEIGNASFSPLCNDFVFGNNMSTLDVLAHEFTHGVTRCTSNLGSDNQPGALNESFSDVFAMLIDDDGDRFIIGEGTALPLSNQRSMENPKVDHISKFVNTPDTEPGDYGAVHTNCSITNKAAFLIFNGGTHNGFKISGIGLDKTAQLYYFVLTSLLGSNDDLSTAATTLVNTASIFAKGIPGVLPPNQFGFTNFNACTVKNAFASVGLATGDNDCDGIEDSVDPDVDADGVPNATDNCPTISNPAQNDANKDGEGDMCDDDIDGDGVKNDVDNCPLIANSNQQDWNHNKRGDVCDDADGDGIPDAVDKCKEVRSYNNTDSDGDGFGDVCDPDDDNDGIPDVSDNCPLVNNKYQEDTDGDGVGDACDNCRFAANSTQSDLDFDHLGDACDTDDDDDGIPDTSDNCPTIYNPDQADGNHNGIGTACDWAEVLAVGEAFRRQLERSVKIDLPKIKTGLPKLPDLGGGDCPDCPIYLPSDLYYEVKVSMKVPRTVQILDSEGFVVARSVNEREPVLRFFPQQDAFFERNPRTNKSQMFQGRGYKLEIVPNSGNETPGIGTDFNIKIDVKRGEGF